MRKSIISLLLLFHFLYIFCMQNHQNINPPTQQQNSIDEAIQIVDATNTYKDEHWIFQNLLKIKIIIFLQKYLSEHINFESYEEKRINLDKTTSEYIYKKYLKLNDQTLFSNLCINFFNFLDTNRKTDNPILKQAYFSDELQEIYTVIAMLEPLHFASILGLENIIIKLLNQGHDPDCKSFKFYIKTPIYFCAFNGLTNAVKKLLQKNANPEGAILRSHVEKITPSGPIITPNPWITSAHQAILWYKNKPEILQLLIDGNVNLNIISPETSFSHGNQKINLIGTPLQWAHQLNHQNAINLLEDKYIPEYYIPTPMCNLI
ncbi:hypothetical protein GF322_01105 [Candidatus Dependentiae bacterium]|nr:hypothetical protein [Candidatus Dependentiae bacterium]